jgi:putative Holliday junction resolvase
VSGRILGLDLGDARIGLALSDPLGITAQPAGVLASRGERRDVQGVRELVERHGVTRVVVGRPLLMSGEVGEQAARADAFAARLRGALSGIDVDMWDERLTTVEVERAMIAANVRHKRRREVADALSAVLILQSYMDAHPAVAGGGNA